MDTNTLAIRYANTLNIRDTNTLTISPGYRFADPYYYLGQMFEEGQGIQQNYREAASWYRKAAERGDISSAYSLGVLYHKALGVQQDYQKAAAWYRVAAEKGHADALYNLGVFLENGYLLRDGIRLYDRKLAMKYFSLAAKRLHVEAKQKLKELGLN